MNAIEMRAVLTPGAPHMSPRVVVAVLVTGIFWTSGMRSFVKRAVR